MFNHGREIQSLPFKKKKRDAEICLYTKLIYIQYLTDYFNRYNGFKYCPEAVGITEETGCIFR